MSVKHLYKGITIVLFCLVFSMSYAQQQNKETLDDVSQRVKVLEGQKENLDGRFNNKSDALDLKFEKLEKKLKDDYNYIKFFLWIFGSISIITIFTLYGNLKKRILEIADKKINEKFDSLLDEKKSSIIEIIENHDMEIQLKKTKKILVLTPKDADDSFVKKFFKNEDMRFNQDLVHYASPNDHSDFNNYDLVFFNDEKRAFSHEKILEIMGNAGKDNVFFYFGPKHLDFGDFKDRVNFANSRVQIYGNLINALRYQKLLQ